MFEKELELEIERIDYEIRKLVDGYLFGHWLSKSHGTGFEFDMHRPYSAWPQPKHIDWPASIKSDSPELLVRTFSEEHSVPVHVIAHLDKSSDFGSYVSKRRRVAAIAASIAYSAFKLKDQFTFSGYGSHSDFTIRGQAKTTHKLVARGILAPQTPASDNVPGLFKSLRRLPKYERAFVLFVTDLNDDPELHLEARREVGLNPKHDVIGVLLVDEREIDLGIRGPLGFSDLTGRAVRGIVTKGSALRLKANYESRLAQWSEIFGELIVSEKSDEDLYKVMRVFAERRAVR